MASKLQQTAKNFLDKFETLDIEGFEPLMADNYTHQFAPASINPPGPFDKPGVLKHFSTFPAVMSGFPVTPKEFIVSESSRQVVVWADAKASFRDDVKDDGLSADEWIYHGEFVFMFSMDESGEKLIRTVEFLNSKATADNLMPLLMRAYANKEKISSSEQK